MTPVGVRPLYGAEDVQSQYARCKTASRSRPFVAVRSGNGGATPNKSCEHRRVICPKVDGMAERLFKVIAHGGAHPQEDGNRCCQVCIPHLV